MLSNGFYTVLCITTGLLLLSKLCLSVSDVSDDDCLSRGRNCSWCLSDGNCGFCDKCGDHCHKSGAIHSLENCTNCASCIPGTLAGSKKGYECRVEWYYYEKCPEVVSEQKTVYVEIALYLINLHSVDLKAGTFHADFYLYFKVPEGQTMYTKQKCHDGLKGACLNWSMLQVKQRYPVTKGNTSELSQRSILRLICKIILMTTKL